MFCVSLGSIPESQGRSPGCCEGDFDFEIQHNQTWFDVCACVLMCEECVVCSFGCACGVRVCVCVCVCVSTCVRVFSRHGIYHMSIPGFFQKVQYGLFISMNFFGWYATLFSARKSTELAADLGSERHRVMATPRDARRVYNQVPTCVCENRGPQRL